METKPSAVATPSGALEPRTRFFIPPPNPGAVQQIVDLAKERKLIDAARITAMEATPHAVWFTDGSPSDVRAAVRKTVKAAALLRTVPVLVAYNMPFRDCAQYSAGGALDTAAYEAWIDGFAAGIGNGRPSSSSSPTVWDHPLLRRVVPPTVPTRRGTAGPRPGRGSGDPFRAAELRRRQLLAKARPTRRSTSTAPTAPGWTSATSRTDWSKAGVQRAAGSS